jgi:NAD-dependent SIR2 family protein deacetylase
MKTDGQKRIEAVIEAGKFSSLRRERCEGCGNPFYTDVAEKCDSPDVERFCCRQCAEKVVGKIRTFGELEKSK